MTQKKAEKEAEKEVEIFGQDVTRQMLSPLPPDSNLVRKTDVVDVVIKKNAFLKKKTTKTVHELLAVKLVAEGKATFVDASNETRLKARIDAHKKAITEEADEDVQATKTDKK